MVRTVRRFQLTGETSDVDADDPGYGWRMAHTSDGRPAYLYPLAAMTPPTPAERAAWRIDGAILRVRLALAAWHRFRNGLD